MSTIVDIRRLKVKDIRTERIIYLVNGDHGFTVQYE